MMNLNLSASSDRGLADRGFRYLLMAALVVTFLLVVMGNVVHVSDAAGACPDWPTCFGQMTFPAGAEARLQVAHRALAGLSTLLVFAAAGLSLRRTERGRARLPLFLAVLVMSVQVVLGGLVVIEPRLPALPAVHQVLALAALAFTAAAAAIAFLQSARDLPRPALRTRFSILSAATLAALLVLLVSGAVLSVSGAAQTCSGWPLCGGGLPATPAGWFSFGHRILTAVVSLLVLVQFFRAWRTQRSQPVQLVAATGVFIFLIGQVLIGALKVSRGFPADLVGLHAASAAGLWGVQVLLVTAVLFTHRTQVEEDLEAAVPLHFRARLKDFYLLSKPLIVALLLVTTYSGMVVGGHAIPGFWLTFWTLLGGALAAGGSSALNQYIDREVDKEMQRTAKRPLPAGRLLPGEGLAYGLAACLAAFFVMAGFVNVLAAVLSLAGMIYYVLIYSIWLKRLTVQNIVIGGGAGAIPPLVGWAAATGSLNIPALILFAIVFLWTPPHFWALALVRRNDYARASIPMLPVVRGEHATRVQIFIYSLELVALTLLLPVFHITGSVYLISAAVLGAYLIYSAFRVLRSTGNKTAWQMYKYTSMYLMLLFLALVVDVLI